MFSVKPPNLNLQTVKTLFAELFQLAKTNKFDELEAKCLAYDKNVLSFVLNLQVGDDSFADMVLHFKSMKGFQLLKKYGFNFKAITKPPHDYLDKFLWGAPDYFDLIYTPSFYPDLCVGNSDIEISNVVKGHLLKAVLAYEHPSKGGSNKAIEEIEKLLRNSTLLFSHALAALLLASYKQKKELFTAIWQLLQEENYKIDWQQTPTFRVETDIIHCLLRLGEKYFDVAAHVIKTVFPSKENWKAVEKHAEALIQEIFKTENQKLIAELIDVFKTKNLKLTPQMQTQSNETPKASKSSKRNAKKREKRKEKELAAKTALDVLTTNEPVLPVATTEATSTIAATPIMPSPISQPSPTTFAGESFFEQFRSNAPKQAEQGGSNAVMPQNSNF